MEVEITKMRENNDTFSVCATVKGEDGSLDFRHTFPKNSGYLEEDDGIPEFVKIFKEKYVEAKELNVSSEGVEGKNCKDYCENYEL